jgi:hypothetical protein
MKEIVNQWWRPLVIAVLGALLAVGGWTTSRTATMSDRHPSLIEYQTHLKENREDFREMQRSIKVNQKEINDKVDRLIEHLIK